MLALYLVPVWLFRRGLRHPDVAHRALATAGVLMPVAFVDFGLSYSFLASQTGAVIYASWLVLLWALYRHARLEQEITDQSPAASRDEEFHPAA